jgi:hypothetical protein
MRRRNDYERQRAEAFRELQQLNQRQRERAKEQAEEEQRAQKRRQAAAVAAAASAAAAAVSKSHTPTEANKSEVSRVYSRPAKKKHIFLKVIAALFVLALASRLFSDDTSTTKRVEDTKETVESSASNERVASEESFRAESPQISTAELSNNSSTISPPTPQASENEMELSAWLGMPTDSAIEKYGHDYLTDWFEGQYFYYEEGCPYNFFYNPVTDNFASAESSIIAAVSTGVEGTPVVYGIQIGDNIQAINNAIGVELHPTLHDGDELQLPCAVFATPDGEEYSFYFNQERDTLILAEVK